MNNAERLAEFIGSVPDAAFGARYISKELDDYGFEGLEADKPFKLKRGGAYYVLNGSACVLAFTVGQNVTAPVFKTAAAHLDSPAFKIKKSPTLIDKGYIRLNAEAYGGLKAESWFDRPLSLAGRVIVKGESPLKPREVFIDFKRPMLIIPSLAPHFKNESKGINPQKELLPLCGALTEGKTFDFEKFIAREAKTAVDSILDYEFTVYNAEKGNILGLKDDFLSAPRLDDLMMVFCICEGFKKERSRDFINVALFLDNEEVGSLSSSGARSVFLRDTLRRIGRGLGFSEEEISAGILGSIGVSADAAHAYHPSYGEKYDITAFPVLNGGIVIKYAASRTYSTEAYSAAVFKEICIENNVPVQSFYNRSGIKGGSAVGAPLSAGLGFSFVEVGLPILSMHSARELCGSADIETGIRLFKAFYGI